MLERNEFHVKMQDPIIDSSKLTIKAKFTRKLYITVHCTTRGTLQPINAFMDLFIF